MDEGAGAMYVVDLKTNRASVLPGSEGMWSPRWSPDGRSIAGLSAKGRRLILYDVRTHMQTVLNDMQSGSPSWSPDGQFLFFGSGGTVGGTVPYNWTVQAITGCEWRTGKSSS